MKANELRDFIRPLILEEVREEVQRQLPKLLFEMLGSQSKPMLRESVEPTHLPTGQFGRNTDVIRNNPPTPQPKKELKRFAKDPVLNQILNETTPGLPQTPYGGAVDLGNGGFDKIGNVSEEFKTEVRNIMNEGVEFPVEQAPIQEAPNPLKNLFNKNFKAILDKSKERGSGGGGFSKILQTW